MARCFINAIHTHETCPSLLVKQYSRRWNILSGVNEWTKATSTLDGAMVWRAFRPFYEATKNDAYPIIMNNDDGTKDAGDLRCLRDQSLVTHLTVWLVNVTFLVHLMKSYPVLTTQLFRSSILRSNECLNVGPKISGRPYWRSRFDTSDRITVKVREFQAKRVELRNRITFDSLVALSHSDVDVYFS